MENRALTAQEVMTIKIECEPIHQVTVQKVVGGFLITGAIEWRKDGNSVAVQRDSAMALTAKQVSHLVDDYLTASTFEVVTLGKNEPQD